MRRPMLAVAILSAGPFAAWAQKPMQSQSPSTMNYHLENGQEVVEITNVVYEVTSDAIPGRPAKQRLLVRKVLHLREVLEEVGTDEKMTVESWPLGTPIQQKPIYSLTLTGGEVRTEENALLVASRGTEEMDWWSVYKLGTGEHLFDTYAPMVKFSLKKDVQELRFVGLEVPPDDAADKRLTDGHVVAVLTYAAADHVIREVLITADNPDRARLARSYADTVHTLGMSDGPGGKTHTVVVGIRASEAAPDAGISLKFPVLGDDLDVAHAVLPAHFHAAKWKR